MPVLFDFSSGILHIKGNINCDIGDILREMGHVGPGIRTPPQLNAIYMSGSSRATLNHAGFLRLGSTLCITMIQKSCLIINPYPDTTINRIVISMSGVSECSVYSTVISAGFSLAGKTKCTFTQPIECFSVESISTTAALYVAGETITRTMKRTLDVDNERFNDVDVDKYQYSCSSSSSSSISSSQSEEHSDESTPPLPRVQIKTQKRPIRPEAGERPKLAHSLKPSFPGKRASLHSTSVLVNHGSAPVKPRLPTSILKKKQLKKQ
jgi:hypothetical protein